MNIEVKPKAKARIVEILTDNPQAIGARFGLRKYGCTGYAFFIDTLNEIADDDISYTIDEKITLYVPANQQEMVDGTAIDYHIDSFSKKFTYHNPKINDMCGCGVSFNFLED